MYAPERRQERDLQNQRDPRYVSDETFYYRGPDAGAVTMRGSEPYNNARGFGVQASHYSQLCTEYTVLTRRRNTRSFGTMIVVHSLRDAVHHGRHSGPEETVATIVACAQDPGRVLGPGTNKIEF
jgi:hypothetical protein